MIKINWKEHYLIVEKLIKELKQAGEFHKADYLTNYKMMCLNNMTDKERDEVNCY